MNRWTKLSLNGLERKACLVYDFSLIEGPPNIFKEQSRVRIVAREVDQKICSILLLLSLYSSWNDKLRRRYKLTEKLSQEGLN